MKSTTSTVTPSLLILITSFHVKVVVAFYIGIEKVQLADLQLAREWWALSSLCALARSIDVRKGNGVLVETAFTNFKKMYEVARECHKDAIAVCDAFVERRVVSARVC